PIAQVIDKLVLGARRRDYESLIKTPIRRLDSEVLVQHEERLAQGRNDVLAIVEAILHQTLLPSAFAHVAKHQHHSGDFTVRMTNRSGAVVNGAFRAVFRNE